ncbi:MAG TPA: hypothetical protein VG899_14605 [Mycobacteriales bacterium]|nr:hypothetical protein [Mycobacteriales bacterium]HWA67589.1 hypothetical protein [Mycobacteriales bacterium]
MPEHVGTNPTARRVGVAAFAAVAAMGLAACGSSSSGGSSTVNPGAGASTSSDSGSADTAATSFSVANVSGLGNVVVDGRGRTVYVLTKGTTKNAPCTDASGCTKYWPDLSLPDGTTAATAGSGLNSSLLATKQADGETYATYNGWLLYEYVGDTAAGQGHGQGVKDTWGTWYALSASGDPVTAGTPAAASTASSSSGSTGSSPATGGGYGY